MSGLTHVDDYPEIPVSLAPTNTVLKTGTWRSVRPVVSPRLAPCSAGCPAGMEFPSYAADIAAGRIKEAFATVVARNPFPRITGRVCPHLCEDHCNLSARTGQEPVSIRALERWLGDETAHLPHEVSQQTTGHSVAVVGSGPAGMSAAYYLRRSGHSVTVYDRQDRPGGMLRYGIPEYRLPASVVDAEIERLEEMGIEFVTGSAVGVDVTLSDLQAGYSAVFVATGAWQRQLMGIDGESLLEPGLQFLEETNRGQAKAPGANCAVIGGGNTAMDVARVLIRLGAEVTVLYRRTADEMPAIREEYEQAVADGVVFRWLVAPQSVEKDGDELLVRLDEMALGEPDHSGRRSPVPTGATEELRFDAVFSAIGERADTSLFPDRMKDDQGWLELGQDGATSSEKVRAGGDLVTGPATVIDAIVSGRRAARAIDRELGLGKLWHLDEPLQKVSASEVNPTYLAKTPRAVVHRANSPGAFTEEHITMSEAEALLEIERCLSCGHCNACMTCFVFCPDGAVKWDEGPIVDLEFCKGCGICVAECPGHALILVNERDAVHA